jgi:citrate lyase subunit beta/citryl-CoA lyase
MNPGYSAQDVGAARSLLFVPGNRPERFAKAAAAQPDIVILDLEDAVAAPDKDLARAHAGQWLSAGNPAMVRINAAGTPWHERDLELIRDHRAPAMLAKAETPDQIGRITDTAPGVPVVPLIETAIAVAEIHRLCAVPGVVRVAFGSIDLANELGVDPDDREALLLHRSMLVLASAAARLAPPIDGVTTVFTQTQPVTDDVHYARRRGLTAKLCIHPAQVSAVHAALVPSDSELSWARRIVDALGSGESAAAVDGQMVDLPVLERARRILATAGRA